jgi:hypothetical protein
MPNAQTHLAAACDLNQTLSGEAALSWLADDNARAAFLLGSISPDVRVVSGQQREETHFFTIPPIDARRAEDAMPHQWPNLRSMQGQRELGAAFVAGYMTHLAMDQVWVSVIVMPRLFSEGHPWGVDHPNWRLYSILMTYLEYQSEERLSSRDVTLLASVRPDRWLPFVKDQFLLEWRDYVVEMIQTDGARRTSELFARSNGLSGADLEAIVLSDQRMAAEVFLFVSQDDLAAFEAESMRRSQQAVRGFLAPA